MLLAKSKPKRSLIHHTLDVTAVAQQYVQKWQHLAELIDDSTLFDDLIFAALVHDLGKAASGFQAILRGEADETWQGYRHEILSAALIAGLPYSERRQDLLLVVMTHHFGFNDELGAQQALYKYDPREDSLTPFSERLGQLREYWSDLRLLIKDLELFASNVQLFSLPDDPLELSDPFVAIRESQRPRGQRLSRSRQYDTKTLNLRRIFLRGLLVGADHIASAAVTEANADNKDIVETLPILSTITPEKFSFELNKHQALCAKTKGNIFLNAPTGSGKTEASLLWAQYNQSEQQSRHLFYVLPFTASINAMYYRLRDEMLFGEDAVSFLHGRSSYFAYRWLCEQRVDPKQASRVARAARRQAKELYYPVKVLTPHQIVMSFLGAKGWERSFCEYAGGLFIMDEIHAYNPKFSGLLFETLRRLTQELGAKVCIMSATFPSLLKKVLIEQVGTVSDIHLDPIELNRYSRHHVSVVNGSIEDYFEDIKQKLQQGFRVLVVANTVKGAMACFEVLKGFTQNACLIHGRLIQEDRQNAEKRLANNV